MVVQALLPHSFVFAIASVAPVKYNICIRSMAMVDVLCTACAGILSLIFAIIQLLRHHNIVYVIQNSPLSGEQFSTYADMCFCRSLLTYSPLSISLAAFPFHNWRCSAV